MTHCRFSYSCCNWGRQRETNALCIWPHNTIPSETCHLVSAPLPTLGGYFTACGIITLDPFPRETGVYMSMTSLPEPQPNTHKCTHTGICLIHDANRSWGNRVWWECLRIHSTKVKLHRQMRWEVWNTHTQTHTHSQCSINPHLGFVNEFGGQTDKQRHTNTLTITHSKWHGQTLYCAHPQTITHSHTHGLLCVYSVSWSYLCGQLLCSSRHWLPKGKEE